MVIKEGRISNGTNGHNGHSPYPPGKESRLLSDLFAAKPCFQALVRPEMIARCQRTIDLVPQIVTANTFMIDHVDEEFFKSPQKTSLLIEPVSPTGHTLVIARTGLNYFAFSPVLGSSLLAIDKWAEKEKVEPGEYRLTQAEDLICILKNSGEMNGLITYRNWMKPEDFIALGARGLLPGETFRMDLNNLVKSLKKNPRA